MGLLVAEQAGAHELEQKYLVGNSFWGRRFGRSRSERSDEPQFNITAVVLNGTVVGRSLADRPRFFEGQG
jgi:hypothetical protein